MNYIISTIKRFPEIEKAMIFGSRAMGNYKKGSDIDIACFGNNISLESTSRLKSILNEALPIPFFVDVLCFDTLDNTELKMHIKHFGITIYSNTTN